MKKNRILLTTITLLALSQTIQATSEGEQLFYSKCSDFQTTKHPTDMNRFDR